ncbi:MAG: hypothetical protein LBU32_29530, partial [Clostridiales bacterium]|nr:hypothetical protein [Clostridiales bacterium]
CVRHAASVHPEPGSNSQVEISQALFVAGPSGSAGWLVVFHSLRFSFLLLFSFQGSLLTKEY